jgi:tetratricopeptide (TPR) repeat protein
MENKIKRDPSLINLVTDFETKYENGDVGYLDEKVFIKLIGYYEDEFLLEKAIEIVDCAIEQYKFRSDFYIIKARLLLSTNKGQLCLDTLDIAESIAPFEKEINLLRIRALSSLKKFDNAREIIEEMGEGFTKSEAIELLIAESYFYEYKKDYDAMYDTLAKAALIDGSYDEVLERIWIAAELARRYEDSLDLHLKITDKEPYNYLAWYNLGHAYNCTWDYEKAIDALEYSFIINPEFESGYLDCGDTCIQMRKFDKALEVYMDADKKFGPNNETMVAIANCHINLNNIPQARQWLIKAIKLDNFNDEAYYLLGECYYKTNVWYNAINAYHKAIEIEDRREEYYYGLAKAYIAIEDHHHAIHNFQMATQTGPEETIYWREYCCYLMKIGKFEMADQVLEEAENYTYGTDLLYCKSVLHFLEGDLDSCHELLLDALEENFSEHAFIFDIAPEMKLNKEIIGMIKYYSEEI